MKVKENSDLDSTTQSKLERKGGDSSKLPTDSVAECSAQLVWQGRGIRGSEELLETVEVAVKRNAGNF